MGTIIKHKAYAKIEAYARAEKKKGEIGGLLLGKLDGDGDVTIKDAILLKQLKTDTSFEIDDDALMDLTKNASAKRLKSIVGWWHSHHTMSTFWSPTDVECFKRICNLSGFCFGVVVAFGNGKKANMRMKSRVMIKNKKDQLLDIDDIKVDIYREQDYVVDIKKLATEIKGMVSVDERPWIMCPTCSGHGEILEEDLPPVFMTMDDFDYAR